MGVPYCWTNTTVESATTGMCMDGCVQDIWGGGVGHSWVGVGYGLYWTRVRYP